MSGTNGEKPRFESAEPLPDRPGTNPERDDQLGYASFAKNLAQAIARITPTDGLVIALYGPWGSGKSTVLNFVESYLARENDSGIPTVVKFNPWWFADRNDLIRTFFDQLLGQLARHPMVRSAGRALGGLSPLVQVLVSLTDKGSPHLSALTKIYLAASRCWQGRQSSNISELKTKIGRKLQAASSKILVVVDDIDRLSGSEVREVFRLIKSVGDFPNITYLLAFDREAVCRMLEPVQGGTGEEYLGKIVQIPFELGTPDRAALHQMLFRRLNAILAATPQSLFDTDRWQALFSEGVGRIPKTPRDVVRFTNAISLTYGSIRDEVNAVDFIAIEGIRVFLPQVYDVIRRNPEMFCEPSWRSVVLSTGENFKKFHDAWFEALIADGSIKEERSEPLREMLCMLFPRVGKIWGHPMSRRGSDPNDRAKRFISDPDAFPVYFTLAVPETSISRAEIVSLLSLDEDPLTATLKIRSHENRGDGMSRARVTLEVLPDFVRDLAPSQSVVLARSLLRAGDDLLSADRFKGDFIPPQAWLFASALRAALRNIPASDRGGVLSTAIEESAAIGAIAWTVDGMGREHGKDGAKPSTDQEPLVTEPEVARLEGKAVSKIQEAAESGALLNSASLPNTLLNWKRWTENGEVTDWILSVAQNPKALARMLEGLLSEAAINGRVILRLDPEGLRRFADPSQLIDPVRKLVDEPWLGDKEKIAVDAFIRAYEAREKGEDPDPF
jgi:predicted KAP-like P-loop ATPase